MRKAPSQQRSRVTVDVIVEAATRVLARRGWARFTTNEIAAVAGVSVGSLYQYFPDKLAIAEAIRERHLEEVLVALSGSSESDNEAVSLDQRVERFVDGVIAAHSVDQALHRVLVDEVPLAARSSYPEFEAEYQRRYRALVARDDDIGSSNEDDTAARMLSSAVEGVVHAAARRGELGLPALRRELVRLVLAYLRDRQHTG
ncbi:MULTISPECIES: TetR/AcrR family transcriptional regulator [unclassified Variovorax]|jgi:AcrR family transcriptional regulator|uniref:TetR/AcrR family transcriptional regulator n=1 Tax=unclassified Variovorax TaxID=663243 RepID=UPI000F7DD260|nr:MULTISPECIES: TetR/AcrR family transcriptional regulator [unclassified Variovorax]RSZ41070.1 TetR/AcrR family transcriptional regulator [Variovorax sp. 553]RSZ42022.1 TetR/AcrR family transcriptional regulator [Variovorax sp. 679]